MTETEDRNRTVNEGTVNEGTKAKQTLQSQALRYMASYSSGQSLETYAELLCWDIHVTRRTALESYILPMLRHGYLKYVGESKYSGKAVYNFTNSQEQGTQPQKPELPEGLKPNPHLEPDPESLLEHAKKHPHKPEQPKQPENQASTENKEGKT